ncbi:hypothetical protein ACLB2K_012936 [Fragaria x ananassa]
MLGVIRRGSGGSLDLDLDLGRRSKINLNLLEALREDGADLVAIGLNVDSGLVIFDAFVVSFSMILVSENGDETFLIETFMQMRHPNPKTEIEVETNPNMCYVGKATKIFIFVVTILVRVGIVLGFGILSHNLRDKSHKCSDNSCGSSPLQFPSPTSTFNLISTPPPPSSTPSHLTQILADLRRQ